MRVLFGQEKPAREGPALSPRLGVPILRGLEERHALRAAATGFRVTKRPQKRKRK
jgi:hypothetical protein